MIRFLLKNSRWTLLLSIFGGLASGLGGVGMVAVINKALEPEQSPAGLGWLFAGLCALLLSARVMSALLMMRLGQKVIFDLRIKLSEQIMAAPLAVLQQLGSARLMACLTEDVTTMAEAIRWLPLFCVNAAIVSGCLLYLGWLSPLFVVLVAVTIAVGVLCVRLISKRAFLRLQKARESDDALHEHFRGLAYGIKELKLHQSRRDAFLSECLASAASQYRRHNVTGMGHYILAFNSGNALFYVLLGAALFLLPGFQSFLGQMPPDFAPFVPRAGITDNLTPEELRGFCLTILYMMSPLVTVMECLPMFDRAGIALEKIRTLTLSPEAGLCGDLPATAAQTADLELNGVTHRYHNEREERSFMLGPINLNLYPGEVVFLIGGNGSGKTTLALLLTGLYSPEQGEIRLGGCEITNHNRESYRQQFSAVFSDYYLFDSLLGFQNRELDADARACLVHLQLDHKVQIDQGVFSTLNLSQGQRKRLALLVAYLEDRPFYLFDEWAADQDPVFKNIFYTEILPALKARGKTVVVITHDDGFFHLADRCLKLNDGRLTEISVEKQETESCNNADNEWQQTELEMSS